VIHLTLDVASSYVPKALRVGKYLFHDVLVAVKSQADKRAMEPSCGLAVLSDLLRFWLSLTQQWEDAQEPIACHAKLA
jgi:hypothetical protein